MSEALERRSPDALLDPRARLDEFYYRTTSPETRRAYKRVVEDFWNYIQSVHPEMLDIRTDCHRLTPGDIQTWRDWLIKTPSEKTGKKRRPATVEQALYVVKALFDTFGVTPNPADSKFVQRPVVNNVRPDFLRAPQIRNILAGPDQITPRGARDYAILMVFVRMIPRRSELSRMLVSDISGEPRRWKMRVVLKGGREFFKPIPEDVKEAIDKYLALDEKRRHIQKCDGPDAPLFQPDVNYKTGIMKKGLSGRMIWEIVHKWVTYAGYKQGAYPHVFRASFATAAFKDERIKVDQIMAAGGWMSPSMPLRYNKSANDIDRNAISLINIAEGD
jgi:site-specific recombinase XerD